MKINSKKFTYSTLSRNTLKSGYRTYKLPNGREVPSVTTILSNVLDTSALDDWRIRVGKEASDNITKESSIVGTLTHNYLENYANNIWPPEKTNNIPKKLALKIAASIIKNGLKNINEVWGVEVSLYFTNLYAGTTDLVCIHNSEPSIIDYKTSRKPKKIEWIEAYFLQLAAYILSHNEIYNTRIKKGVIMMASKDAPYTGKYQEFILEGNEFDKACYSWFKTLEIFYKRARF